MQQLRTVPLCCAWLAPWLQCEAAARSGGCMCDSPGLAVSAWLNLNSPSHDMTWSWRTLADTDAAHALPIPTTLSHLPHHTTACRAVHRHSTRGPTDHSASATTSLRRQALSPATEHTIPALYPSPVLDHRKWMMAAEATDTNPVDVPPTEPSPVSQNTSRVRRRALATAQFPERCDSSTSYSAFSQLPSSYARNTLRRSTDTIQPCHYSLTSPTSTRTSTMPPH